MLSWPGYGTLVTMKNIALSLLFVLSGTTFLAAQEATPTDKDVGYAFGLLMGQSLSTSGLTYDQATVIQGLQDALTQGAKPRMDAEAAKTVINTALIAVEAKATQAKVEKEQKWLADHGKAKGVVTTTTGLQYEVLKKGTGAKPTTDDVVKVDYVGTLTDGSEFDSSIARGEPAVFPVGQVIPGWVEGIQLMEVGAKYRFAIPSALAYGAEGAGGVIPPYATLIFEVELLSIEAPEAPAQ